MLRAGLLMLALVLVAGTGKGESAEYLGRDIDGEMFSCTAFSYSTSNFYFVQVMFSGSDATLYFSSGGSRTVTIDDEEIEDPSDISAYDYENSVFWDLDVDLD